MFFNSFQPIKKFLIILFIMLSQNILFAEEHDIIEVSQNDKTIIFVSENTIVYGTTYIYNGSKTTVNNIADAKKKWKAKPKSKSFENQLLLKKLRNNQLIQNIQKKINSRENYTYKKSSEQQISESNTHRFSAFVGGGYSNPSFISNFYSLSLLKIQIGKLKFQTSVSFLQYSRLLGSFLRGPPSLS